MLALALLALVPVVMWTTQSVLLRRAGLPLRAKISSQDLPRRLKRVNRGMTNGAFVAVLIAYPLLRGQSPLSYYARLFPLGDRPSEMLHGVTLSVLYLGLLYLAWILTDNVRVRARSEGTRLIRRLAGVPLTALFGALTEELLFRAMLLADLLESFSPLGAVTIGSVIFAGAHYVRSVKRYWTVLGHAGLGLTLCVAFVLTEALWLSIGLHAGGTLILMGVRPFVRYRGPKWLVGASVFPYAGGLGLVGLGLLTINLVLVYGGA